MTVTLKDPSLFKTKAYVNGQWIDADSGKTFPVHNPATGEKIADVPRLGRAETRRAIEAAEKAWPAWKGKLAKERAQVMRRFFDLIMANADDLATIMTLEQGKPLAEAKGEIVYAASFVEWFGEEAKRVYGDTIPEHRSDARIVVRKEAIGVTAGITPWNFPSAMITRKAAPALAAGCPMVIKPSEDTPLSALAMAELAERAGFPAGIVSVVTGAREDAAEIGLELTTNPIVRKIGFTGSTAVGKILMQNAASTVKKVSLELGGNAPLIVFDDADIDLAIDGTMTGKFRNAGQVCVAPNRILVQDGIFDRYVDKLAARVQALKVGNGLEAGVNIGPLINERGFEKVQRHIDQATGAGASVMVGGHAHNMGGSFFQPTVMTGVNTDMDMMHEETFGPVAALMRFKSEDDAVRIANDTPYGLASYFFSRDISRCFRVAERLETGMVGINNGLLSNIAAPFGGVKQSGLGREGGFDGIHEFLQTKFIGVEI
jgi:succinate-semialdehyde dehydrogenase/glutarate-semialdehyde dehydrogenase